MRCSTSVFAILLFSLGACTGSSTDTNGICDGAKCDTPGNSANVACAKTCEDASNRLEGEGESDCRSRCREEAALLHCEARKKDAIDSSQKTFTKDAIRWAASDVSGVNTKGRDDRGQEYTEYFPIVQLPPKGGTLPDVVTPGRLQANNRPPQPLSLDLTEDQIFDLEDSPNAEVGSCLFTSWHQDIDIPLPICNGSDATCPNVTLPAGAVLPPWTTERDLGIPLTSSFMKMKISINSNGAAADLFEKCLVEPKAGDPDNAADPLHDDFTRGCMKTFELFQTEWRRSDPSVCAAGIRLTECGCGVDTDGDGTPDITDPVEISRAVVPRQPNAEGVVELRGFPLGTWSGPSELPVGCNYVDTGDSSQTLVMCKLTAGDVLANQGDVKEFCRQKYGDDVVVHVPVPAAAIACNPPADGQYNNCSDMPWIVTAESSMNGGGDVDPEPEPDRGSDCEIDPASADSSVGNKDECDCVAATCGEDPFCCTTDWDGICVDLAKAQTSCAEYF